MVDRNWDSTAEKPDDYALAILPLDQDAAKKYSNRFEKPKTTDTVEEEPWFLN